MANKIYIHGRLTADPELKNTQSGVAVSSFSVACDRSFAKQGEDKQSDFFNVTAWRGLAELVCKHFKKGKEIIIHGEMQSRTYTDNNGVSRLVWDVQADSVEFCGPKGENANVQQATPPTAYDQQASADMQEAATDENLPF